MDFILYTMMKKLIYLISLVSALSLCSCNDEDVVFPKSTAELIAEKIQSYHKSTIHVPGVPAVFSQDVPFVIEIPFIILKWSGVMNVICLRISLPYLTTRKQTNCV